MDERQKNIIYSLVGKKVLIVDKEKGFFVTTLKKTNGNEWKGAASRKIIAGKSFDGLCDPSLSKLGPKTKSITGSAISDITKISDDAYNYLMSRDY